MSNSRPGATNSDWHLRSDPLESPATLERQLWVLGHLARDAVGAGDSVIRG